ncbi:hypothetical protein PIROE2DRAFT_4399, partial [Piromyces sp. E2]
NEETVYSVYEFIYSYRNSINSPFPDLTSQESIDALNMIRRIKEEVSSDDEFVADGYSTIMKLVAGNAIFLKYIIFPEAFINPAYKMTILPGRKEGISTSMISGTNIGINGNIPEKNKEAALIAYKYLTSKELQKKYLLQQTVVTGIWSLYEDEDICKNGTSGNCELFKNLQMVGKPNKNSNEDYYIVNFKKYCFDFIYGNDTAKEVLKKIDDMTKIYYISMKTKDSYIGLITVIIISIIITCMLISLIFIFRENFNPFFDYLSIDLWILLVIGSILLLSSIFTKYGMVTSFKCNLLSGFFFTGLTFTYIPFLYKLIVNFQGDSSFSEWVEKHKTVFFTILIFIEVLLSGLLFLKGISVEDIIQIEGLNFKVCNINHTVSKLVFGILIAYIFIMIFTILIYIFMEWNLEKSTYNIKFILSVIYIDILAFIILLIIDSVKIENYINHFVLRASIIIIISISNYGLQYGFRLLVGFAKKKNMKILFIKYINNEFINNESTNNEVLKENQFNNMSYATVTYNNDNNENDNNNTIKNNNGNNNNDNNKTFVSTGKESSSTMKSHRVSRRVSIISKMIDYHYDT